MRSLITVMKFTIKEMVKRKSFIISTIIILVLIIIGFNIPNILSSISGEDTKTKLLIVDTENIFDKWKVDEKDVIDKTRRMLEFYIKTIGEKSCLNGKDYDIITLDIVFCDSNKTQELNRDYRNKDYPADIITFAIFADDENSFIFDGEINLGEIIIALDKVIAGDNRDISHSKNKEQELFFLISHGLMHLLGFDHQSEEEYNFVIGEQRKALECIDYDKI